MTNRLVAPVCISVLVLLAACGSGNDSGNETSACADVSSDAMGDAKLVGDNVYNMKLEISSLPKPDQSSARKLIESLAPFLDGREDSEMKAKLNAADEAYKAAVRAELEVLEPMLLAPEALAELQESRKEQDAATNDYKTTKSAWKTVSEEPQDDGRVQITVSQEVSTRMKKWDSDEFEESTVEVSERFFCKEIDGKWAIDGKEVRRMASHGRDETPKWDWVERGEQALAFYYMSLDGGEMNRLPTKRPDLKSDSPANTAQALMNQLKPIQSDMRWKPMIDASKALGAHLKDVFSPRMRDKAKADAKELLAASNKGDHEIRGTTQVSDTEAEVEVRLRSSREGLDRLALLKMKKTADGWRVVEAGMLHKFGDDKPTYAKRSTVYDLY